jgi:hypothetical protein
MGAWHEWARESSGIFEHAADEWLAFSRLWSSNRHDEGRECLNRLAEYLRSVPVSPDGGRVTVMYLESATAQEEAIALSWDRDEDRMQSSFAVAADRLDDARDATPAAYQLVSLSSLLTPGSPTFRGNQH